jgi:hypothetical protein
MLSQLMRTLQAAHVISASESQAYFSEEDMRMATMAHVLLTADHWQKGVATSVA